MNRLYQALRRLEADLRQMDLRWALIGGLTSSMFLTLIIVPVVYFMVERMLEKSGLSNVKKVRIPEDVV